MQLQPQKLARFFKNLPVFTNKQIHSFNNAATLPKNLSRKLQANQIFSQFKNPFSQQQVIVPQEENSHQQKFELHEKNESKLKENNKNQQQEQEDSLWSSLQQDALVKAIQEPMLGSFFYQSILNHDSLEGCLIYNLAKKLGNDTICHLQWNQLLISIFKESPELLEAMREDILIVKTVDAAWESHLNTVLYFKGFSGLCLGRVAQYLYRQNRKELAYILQNRTSELFGMDIHPGSYFEKGIFFDHASGLVIGETAQIGSGTIILHNVTLGATGKEPHGSDRHPKVGRNCYIGSNVSILGNISIGDNVKIGAGTVCLKNVPSNKTCVGVPAKILG